MKTAIKAVVNRLGYDIKKISNNDAKYALYSYVGRDGQFDYERYKQAQIAGNKRKIEKVWAREGNIAFLAEYIKQKVGPVEFGICHGTRRGKEQEWFRKYLGCEVIGTEISDTATQFPHTIQWDFHEVKPEWIDGVDFIYSNSFDHSYDPQACLKAWMSCVKRGGVCIIEHSSMDERVDELDPFGASITLLPYLILNWGRGEFSVRELLEAPEKPELVQGQPETQQYVYFLVIERE